MSKKDWAFIAGALTFIGVLTSYAKEKKWKEVHTVVSVAGAGVSLLLATS
jgi:hypothetical protein